MASVAVILGSVRPGRRQAGCSLGRGPGSSGRGVQTVFVDLRDYSLHSLRGGRPDTGSRAGPFVTEHWANDAVLFVTPEN